MTSVPGGIVLAEIFVWSGDGHPYVEEIFRGLEMAPCHPASLFWQVFAA